MAINKNYRKKEVSVMWGGEEIATVSALGTEAITSIVANCSHAIVDAASALDEGEISLAGKDATQAADFLLSEGPALLRRIATAVPEVIVEIIAQAGGDTTEDALESISSWSMPMQVEAIATILRETFVDENTFRSFVGNVMALLQSANALRKEPQQR